MMSEKEVLRDRAGNRIGEIETVSGKQVLRDKYGNRLGEFDPNTQVTRDRFGNRVGTGNLLLTLLKP
jgi:hypothetical protein